MRRIPASTLTTYMGLALEEARAALSMREMPVGCVFVHAATGAVLARGRNRTNIEFNVCLGA